MDYKQALTEIKKGNIRKLYLLIGEEPFLMRQTENEIINALLAPEERDFGLNVLEKDPAAGELVSLVDTVPFMGGKNVLLIRGTQLFKSGRKGDDLDYERIVALFENLPTYSFIIFTANDKADKRKKLYKAVEKQGVVVDFSPLKPKEIRPWIVSKLEELEKKMSPDAMEYVLSAISLMPQVSLGFLNGEMEKAALYSKGRVISKEEVAGIMAAVPEISVFKLIEAVSQKQLALALTLLEEQLTAGENTLRLLALLARQVRMLWQACGLSAKGLSSNLVAEELGVPPFVGEKLVQQSRKFSAPRLAKTLVAIAEADRKLKVGQADSSALEQIIIDICRE